MKSDKASEKCTWNFSCFHSTYILSGIYRNDTTKYDKSLGYFDIAELIFDWL